MRLWTHKRAACALLSRLSLARRALPRGCGWHGAGMPAAELQAKRGRIRVSRRRRRGHAVAEHPPVAGPGADGGARRWNVVPQGRPVHHVELLTGLRGRRGLRHIGHEQAWPLARLLQPVPQHGVRLDAAARGDLFDLVVVEEAVVAHSRAHVQQRGAAPEQAAVAPEGHNRGGLGVSDGRRPPCTPGRRREQLPDANGVRNVRQVEAHVRHGGDADLGADSHRRQDPPVEQPPAAEALAVVLDVLQRAAGLLVLDVHGHNGPEARRGRQGGHNPHGQVVQVPAVGEQVLARVVQDGREEAEDGHGRADAAPERTGLVNVHPGGGDVRGHAEEREPQVLHLSSGPQRVLDGLAEGLPVKVGDERQSQPLQQHPHRAHASGHDVRRTRRAREVKSTGPAGRHERALRGPRDEVHGDASVAERPQNAQVGEPPCASAAHDHAHGPAGQEAGDAGHTVVARGRASEQRPAVLGRGPAGGGGRGRGVGRNGCGARCLQRLAARRGRPRARLEPGGVCLANVVVRGKAAAAQPLARLLRQAPAVLPEEDQLDASQGPHARRLVVVAGLRATSPAARAAAPALRGRQRVVAHPQHPVAVVPGPRAGQPSAGDRLAGATRDGLGSPRDHVQRLPHGGPRHGQAGGRPSPAAMGAWASPVAAAAVAGSREDGVGLHRAQGRCALRLALPPRAAPEEQHDVGVLGHEPAPRGGRGVPDEHHKRVHLLLPGEPGGHASALQHARHPGAGAFAQGAVHLVGRDAARGGH
mmetsp:Transcript_1685/g.6722  ORF Transcript_1685/g.6722 Transcript_1685/m.6722 type:complete len:758 (-) Transcript_1685:1131-3404(-)